MLFPVPYKVPEKKAKKKAKGTRSCLRHRGTSDVMYKDADARSSTEDDEEAEEEKEIHSPPTGKKNKRMPRTHLEVEASKKGRSSLLDSSAAATDNS